MVYKVSLSKKIGEGLELNHKEELEEFIANFPLAKDHENTDVEKAGILNIQRIN